MPTPWRLRRRVRAPSRHACTRIGTLATEPTGRREAQRTTPCEVLRTCVDTLRPDAVQSQPMAARQPTSPGRPGETRGHGAVLAQSDVSSLTVGPSTCAKGIVGTAYAVRLDRPSAHAEDTRHSLCRATGSELAGVRGITSGRALSQAPGRQDPETRSCGFVCHPSWNGLGSSKTGCAGSSPAGGTVRAALPGVNAGRGPMFLSCRGRDFLRPCEFSRTAA